MDNTALYPMKFLPLYKNKVWGGNRIQDLGFDYAPLPNCGELWALSGVEGNESVIANGFLAENTLNEALEIYMGELLGEQNYDRFGNRFPVLLKLIDTVDDLSIQVHPDDELAQRLGMENGKTEMWYVIHSEEDSRIINGFARPVSVDLYRQRLADGTFADLLHADPAEKGDVYFIPAGRVHAIGKNILLAEIQQTSDATFRIFDYNRPDADGRLRPIHPEAALEALDLSPLSKAKTDYNYADNSTVTLAECPYFTTRLVPLTKPMRKDLSQLDSFVVYFCTEGLAAVKTLDTICPMHAGECVLVPAVAEEVELFCEGPAKLLEIYVDPQQWTAAEPHRGQRGWMAQFVGNEDGLAFPSVGDGPQEGQG